MYAKTFWSTEKTTQARKPISHAQVTQRGLMIAGAIVGAVLLIGAMVAPLCAQSYPNKPIRLILPLPPGGTIDILGRIIGQKLAERLGQPVVPENRAGAGGNIGIEYAAKARPDGYTIVLAPTGLAISPSLYKKLNYDPIKDLAPISLIAQTHFVVIVQPSLPVKNLKELRGVRQSQSRKTQFRLERHRPGRPISPTNCSRASQKSTSCTCRTRARRQALIGLMGGEVDMMVIVTAPAIPQIQAGKVRALAVLGNERVPSLPNVPTAKEAGIDNLVVTGWYGILAPAGTPRDIVNRLNAGMDQDRGDARRQGKNAEHRIRTAFEHARTILRIPQDGDRALGQGHQGSQYFKDRLARCRSRIYAFKKTINTTGEPLRVFKMTEMAHAG